MKIKISKTNSKLGLIPSVNLPPIITCRKGCPCAKSCYARKGHFRYSNVLASMDNNYQLYMQNPHTYFAEIKRTINNGLVSYSYFRWHASGDFVDEKYFQGVVRVANELPNTQFLAFTKKYEMVNDFLHKGNTMPSNLHIVFSAWGTSLRVDNPYNLPVSYVRFSDEAQNIFIPDNALECSGDCTNCLQCWHIRNGESVVFNKH